MTDLKEFKTITDTVLSDLTVSDELKYKTLSRLNMKRASWTKTALVPAACAAALVAVVGTGILFNGMQAPQSNASGNKINTMAAVDNKNSSQTPDNTFSPDAQVLETWNVPSMEDAKKYWGGAVLTPSYIPGDYSLKEILAAGPTSNNIIAIMMEFELNGRSFTISQDKGVTKKINPANSKIIDINGTEAMVESTKFDNGDTTIYSTTIRWYKGDFMYAVQGSLSEEEAIKVAESLK